ncbi:MAG: hypothetical protein GEV11_18275 [Streptosporangiales bacterium]|nr:hypothetical protein [Streptosporangiales bacterium]
MAAPVARRMRFRVKHGVFIERPPGEVFDFVSDVENSQKWQATLFDTGDQQELANGKLRNRSKVRDSRNILGKKVESEWQVIDFQPGKTITMELSEGSPVYWKMSFSVEQVDGGTFLTGEGGGDLGEVGMTPAAFGRSCQTMLQNDLNTLRDLLEKAG